MRYVDPRIVAAARCRRQRDKLYGQLAAQTKKQKKKNESFIRDVAKTLKSVWSGFGTAKDIAGKLYNILESPSYYSLHGLSSFH